MTDEGALSRARALEEACDFVGACRAALTAGDARMAARLAALARDDGLFAQAEAILIAAGRATLDLVAADLHARGFGAYAGRLYERAEDAQQAARAYADAGEPVLAAEAFERAQRPADAARTLERALTDDPGRDDLRRLLAELLVRHGRTEVAVRVLQQMSPGEERDRTLPLLARCLEGMGLLEAAREVTQEIEQRGLSQQKSSEVALPAHPTSRTEGTVLFGRYEVKREVAKTPHAHLFEAIDRVSQQAVAVKMLVVSTRGAGRDAFLRFEREAKALAKVRHPTIVSLFAYLPDGPAMVLEWMSGGSLAGLLDREAFAPARAVEIACAVLTALGEAHRLGILHRDVKPSNVLFDEVGAPKLADFGAAHLGDLSATATAGAIGTFAYMSPEQRAGRPATVVSDVYAVGAVLYEMLTGRAAEPSADGETLVTTPSSLQADLTPAHDRLVATLLAERPEDRPADAFAARKWLESLRWPTRVLPRAAAGARLASVRPQAGGTRLEPARSALDGRDAATLFFDTTSEQHVSVLPFDAATAPRVRAFAQVSHAGLAGVLRVERGAGQVWVEPPRGIALADAPVALTPAVLGALREAISLLHTAGGAHGRLDREHVYLHDGVPFVAYPRGADAGATSTDDLRALELLARGA